MIAEQNPPNWLDNLLRGAMTPKPPAIDSSRVKELASRGLLTPRRLTEIEVQELSAAVIAHLISRRG